MNDSLQYEHAKVGVGARVSLDVVLACEHLVASRAREAALAINVLLLEQSKTTES